MTLLGDYADLAEEILGTPMLSNPDATCDRPASNISTRILSLRSLFSYGGATIGCLIPCYYLLSSIWLSILSIFISSAVEMACIKGRLLEALFYGELSKALEVFSTTPSSPEWTLSGELILIYSLKYFEFTYSCCLTCYWAEGAIANLFLAAFALLALLRWLLERF